VERRLPPEIETTLFRIGQESITNISKYARASLVTFSLSFETQKVKLQVVDDGIGFDLKEGFSPHPLDRRGLGLVGMRERAELMSGYLLVESSPGKGTRITVELPFLPGDRMDEENSRSISG
jgi:signal transduction histidine kinase